MFSLARRVIHQVHGDKRTLGLMIFAPLLVLTFIYFLLGDTDYIPTIAVLEENAPPGFVDALDKQENIVLRIGAEDENASFDVTQFLKDGKADAVLSFSSAGIQIKMLESGTKSGKAMAAIQETMSTLNPASKMESDYVYGDTEDSTFDAMGYVFLGIFSFFFVFIISGMALIRERSGGTLERLLISPIKRWQVILGYTTGYGVFAVIQSILIVLYCTYVLKLACAGNILWVILTMLLLAVTAVAFGSMISIFANTEFQMVQLIPVTLIPQVFFSGIVNLETMPYGLGNICYITPIYYGCTAIKKVMVEGQGFEVIWPFLLALTAYTCALCVLNTQVLRKYRRI